ncbi:ribosomal subunit interface protein [Chitiniphilus shinanonensis]|uniref:Ribosomal subunit interface protein n=1 Tax=Chitiniphilus shinanonensis TaxID=553088 RepID=A0ABQ6BT13_9NEIS|nr:HPF/RaiA family ribosome-associated protein [Chitiniphilus shinanonensis]GLS02949.1 ribosomal subunit interface protein [Chitiniphilus shinanonensis]
MQIQVRTDHHIHGGEALNQRVEQTLRGEFARFGDQLTRLEAHFADTNGDKGGGNDIRCTLEARLAGLTPQAATHDADDIDIALDGAIDKLVRQLDSVQGRLEARKRHPGDE